MFLLPRIAKNRVKYKNEKTNIRKPDTNQEMHWKVIMYKKWRKMEGGGGREN